MMNELQKLYEKQIAELAEVSAKCGRLGFVASHGGNLSIKAAPDVILITPTKVAKENIRFEDICIVDGSGKTVFAAPNRKPTGETPMHVFIYQKRPDLKSLVHAHPPVLTGFAIAGNTVLERPILPEPCIELGPILSIPYAEPISQALANCFESVLPFSNAWLMKNHGITIGSDQGVERTLGLLQMAEAMAQSVMVAGQCGGVKEIPRDEVENLSRVLAARDLPCPGDPRRKHTLASLYFEEEK